MRVRLLVALTIAFAFGQIAKADSTYDYSIGVSLQNTVMPGSVVTINAFLLNTGTLPIVFAPNSPDSSVFGGVGADGQWNILTCGFSNGSFPGQFAGVTIAPGDAFEFSFGSFLAPTTQPLGSSAIADLNLGIDFTNMIEGNLLAICPGACTYSNQPRPSFTLGNTTWSSSVTYFQAAVVDRTPVQVPEPASWELLGITAIMMAGLVRARVKSRA